MFTNPYAKYQMYNIKYNRNYFFSNKNQKNIDKNQKTVYSFKLSALKTFELKNRK